MVLFVALARAAAGAGYEGLLEQGGFYLDRGVTYGADAVRALEKARDADPERAASDPKLLSALARAYTLTSRFTEAFWALESWQKVGALPPEGEAIRSRLLSESGLARLRVVSAVPLGQVIGKVKPVEGVRLDVGSRKAVDRLNELLARGIQAGPEGTALLLPEGRHELHWEAPGLSSPSEPASVEVWAGEEGVFRLVPFHPLRGSWKVVSESRALSLSWGASDGVTYELAREVGAVREIVYRGQDPTFRDAGLPVGASVRYSLRVLSPQGELLSVSSLTAETQPPVSQVQVQTRFGNDLRMSVAWELGSGTADRVRVVRVRGGREELVAEVRDTALLRKGELEDAVILPERDAIAITYRVEAWLGEQGSPVAVGETRAEIPRRIAQVAEVVQSIERGSVLVQWDTHPRDGIAQGYGVYVQKGEGREGELVAKVADPFAREYAYEVADPVKAAAWRHFVVPYVGDEYVLDANVLTFRAKVPDETFEKRLTRGHGLPNVALCWDPVEGSVSYEVTVGDKKSALVKLPYVEISGIQNLLMATSATIRVFALDAAGRKTEVLTHELSYRHYPRPAPKEER